MGGPGPRGWAPVGLRSCFLSGRLGRMGGPRRGAGFSLGSFMFPFWAPGSDGWAAAKKLGFHWVPFILPFWAAGSDGWAAANELGSH